MNGKSGGQELVASVERVRLRSSASQWTDPVDLQLEGGTFYFLLGDDDLAKRSLLDLLTLRERPSGGNIHLFGQKANRPRPRLAATLRRRMGIVQDGLPLLPHLDVFDNVALPLRLGGIDERDLRAPVDEMLTGMALGYRAYSDVLDLSLQETCCVAMARAMIARPDLLLIESVFDRVALDCAWRLLQLADSLRKGGATVVAATHDERLAAELPGARTIRISRPARTSFFRSLW